MSDTTVGRIEFSTRATTVTVPTARLRKMQGEIERLAKQLDEALALLRIAAKDGQLDFDRDGWNRLERLIGKEPTP